MSIVQLITDALRDALEDSISPPKDVDAGYFIKCCYGRLLSLVEADSDAFMKTELGKTIKTNHNFGILSVVETLKRATTIMGTEMSKSSTKLTNCVNQWKKNKADDNTADDTDSVSNDEENQEAAARKAAARKKWAVKELNKMEEEAKTNEDVNEGTTHAAKEVIELDDELQGCAPPDDMSPEEKKQLNKAIELSKQVVSVPNPPSPSSIPSSSVLTPIGKGEKRKKTQNKANASPNKKPKSSTHNGTALPPKNTEMLIRHALLYFKLKMNVDRPDIKEITKRVLNTKELNRQLWRNSLSRFKQLVRAGPQNGYDLSKGDIEKAGHSFKLKQSTLPIIEQDKQHLTTIF